MAGPKDGSFFDAFARLGVATVELPTRRLGPGPLLRTLRLIRERSIQVVHSHGKGAGVYGRVAARLARVAAVHTFHGIHYEGYPRVGRALYLALERRLAAVTHTIINVSPSQAAEGLALGLFPPARAVTILNGIDVDDLDDVMASSDLDRGRLGLGPDDLVLGCVTRFDPVKRVESLVRAFSRLVVDLPRARLLLVGDGEAGARIRRLTAAAGVGDRVVVTGFLSEPQRVYPVLDLYVAASLKEGLPLAILEAMAARLAVVATDVPGHRDVVLDGETGLLVPPEDAVAFVAAVRTLLLDPERRRRMGAAGRGRVLKEFTVRPMVEKTAEVYRRAAARRP